MKRLKNLAVVIALFFASQSFAQLSDISAFIGGTTGESQKLIQAYVTPYANALGANLNAGWYNTAKVHKLLGFDVILSTSFCFIPTADKSFDLNSLGLTNYKYDATASTMGPTASGASEDGPKLWIDATNPVNSQTYKAAEFNSPKGSGFGVLPTPMIKAAIGLIKGTELDVRLIPNLPIGGGNTQLWGVGIKHDLMQWIPIARMIPFINLSLMGSYTNLMIEKGLSGKATPDFNAATGKFEMGTKAMNFSLIASVDVPLVTVYLGGGFSSSSTNLKLTGTYPYKTLDSKGNPGAAYIKDPIDIPIDRKNGNNQPNFTVGLTGKFLLGRINLDYTYADYSVLTLGVGISLR